MRDAARRVDLGEGGTPLLRLRSLAPAGVEVLLKEEGGNPTGSFKARGLSLAVNRARELGAPGVQLPSAGNAALALAAYAAAAGLPCRVAMPEDTPADHLRALPPARRRGAVEPGHAGRSRPTAGRASRRLLDPGHAARAVSRRRQEDDALRDRGADGMAAARLDHLSDRRRHRHRRHAQGLRRDARARPGRRSAAAVRGGADGGLRSDRAGVPGRRRERRAVGGCEHQGVGAAGAVRDRGLPHPARAAREPRRGGGARGGSDRRDDGARRARGRAC